MGDPLGSKTSTQALFATPFTWRVTAAGAAAGAAFVLLTNNVNPKFMDFLPGFRGLQDLPPLNDAYQYHYNSNYEQNMDQTAHGI